MADSAWIHEIVAASEARDGDTVAARYAEDGYLHAVPNDAWFRGREAIAKMIEDQSQFSSDERIEVLSFVSDGETFAVEWRKRGPRSRPGRPLTTEARRWASYGTA
jgi:ketosteroid isomerase-like protein